MNNKPKTMYRVTWSMNKNYFTMYIHAVDMFKALEKSHKILKRVGLLYYLIETITAVEGDIPF